MQRYSECDSNHFWAAMIRADYDGLKRFLLRRVSDMDDASDIVQDAYIRLSVVEPEKVCNARAYMFRTAANLATNRRIRDQRRRLVMDEFAVMMRSDQEGYYSRASYQPEDLLQARHVSGVVAEAIRALPKKCRQAFILHRFYPYSYARIAKELDVTVSSVEKYIAKAVAHCKKAIQASSN